MARKMRMTDKVTGRIKCPGLGCHSADVQIVGKKGLIFKKNKYQCRKCGRVFTK